MCGERTGATSLDFGTRIVVLCAAHARHAQAAGAGTPEALRELFVEEGGRRTLLPRRGLAERRLFPARPEGRRQRRGRRQSDGASAATPQRNAGR